MSLDHNLFTLHFKPNEEHPSVTDLVDGAGIVQYQKQRASGTPEYRMNVYEPISGALLASATAPSATSKAKTIELYNPDSATELKYVGTISFRWSFQWEEHDFEWKREECFMLRKPDPPVLVAVTKEAAGRIKTSTVQILDYNLNRFDIYDRKGLELVILTALLSFQDQSDDIHTPPVGGTVSPGRRQGSRGDSRGEMSGITVAPAPAPVPPPKPAPKTGVERIRELHKIRRDVVNEVTIEEECSVDDWAQFCVGLLKDDDLLFITIRSDAAAQVPKVLQVVEESKRRRHKMGVASEEELFQYVVYDTPSTSSSSKGPRVINLDDPSKTRKDSYAPPDSLTVHLSKIPMPELQPNASTSSARSGAPSPSASTRPSDLDDKLTKGKGKAKANHNKAVSSGGKLQKNSSPSSNSNSNSNSNLGTPSHMAHAHQPSPSPSQLGNPMVYVAPPPSSSRPHGQGHVRGQSSSPPAGQPPRSRPLSFFASSPISFLSGRSPSNNNNNNSNSNSNSNTSSPPVMSPAMYTSPNPIGLYTPPQYQSHGPGMSGPPPPGFGYSQSPMNGNTQASASPPASSSSPSPGAVSGLLNKMSSHLRL